MQDFGRLFRFKELQIENKGRCFLEDNKLKLTFKYWLLQDSLRGHFGTSLQWYTSLVDRKNLALRVYLDAI